MSKDRRCRYSDEFKERAVALSQSPEYTVAEAARRLGINRTMLDRWRRDRADDGQMAGSRDDRDDELRRLREENRRLREERTVLKKPRPSSRTSRTEVSIHGRGEGGSRYRAHGPGTVRVTQRLL